MTPTIKAIETRYAGCRFRSRLEARWAVYFNAADIGWQYEPEGFDLPSGRYLPDFYLPDWRSWFEVKPEGDMPSHREDIPRRWVELVQMTRQPLYVAYGMPRAPGYEARVGALIPHPFGGIGMMAALADLCICSRCRGNLWDKASSARFEFGESG